VEERQILSDLDARLRRLLTDRLGWRELRLVQVRAYEPVTAGRHTLVCAPTASGKTEAAFLPLFNRLLKSRDDPLFCLYISPLRALLDDCYRRLVPWMRALDLDIVVRHGERKANLAKVCHQPPHVLMTTPESLEVILVYRTKKQRQTLFRNLKAVVLDEIHNFVPTHRGAQLSNLLVRLLPYVGSGRPQVIGLSASVGDPKTVAQWLAAGEAYELVDVPSGRQSAYRICHGGDPDDARIATDTLTQADKSLVFVPSRAAAETLSTRLKRSHLSVGQSYVHHSSLDAEIKRKHENGFKQRSQGVMVATSTLELGIDIGDLDVVIHYHPPHSADAFLQRSGRAGRRGKASHTVVVAHTTSELLIAAAQVSLAQRDQVERQQPLRWSSDVLLQQLLCLVLEYQSVPRTGVWRRILSRAPAFGAFGEDDWRRLVDDWVRQEVLEISSRDRISMGKVAEYEFGTHNYRGILSSIPFAREFLVASAHDRKTIGTLDVHFALTLEPDDEFLLAGEPWRVVHVRSEEAKVYVTRGQIERPPRWSSGIGGLSYLVAQECWRILTDGTPAPWAESLSPLAADRICSLQRVADHADLAVHLVPATFDPEDDRWWFLTFAGHAANALLRDIARRRARAYDARIDGFSLSFKCPHNAEELWSTLAEDLKTLAPSDLGQFVHEPKRLTTFARFLPPAYLQQANAELQYDLDAARQLLTRKTVQVHPPGALLELERTLRAST